jgi:hypothetical protein
VSDEHEDALKCVSQLIKYSSAHQLHFKDVIFRKHSNIETQWIADKMSTRQTKISEYYSINEGP